jgi:transposase
VDFSLKVIYALVSHDLFQSKGRFSMRGVDEQQATLFSYVSLEQRVPQDHPLRPFRRMVDTALQGLATHLTALYAQTGRPSIPPERLVRALLLQILYSVRSERLLVEQLDYNLLFRWFVGLSLDEAVWDASTFSQNRDRLLAGEIAQAFFAQVLAQARRQHGLSSEHFTVDGTLIEAWASLKSFKPKTESESSPAPPPDDPGNPTVNFRGEKRSNATHASTTDPEARLYKKGPGKEAKLGYLGHVLMENRNGLIVDTRLTSATGTAEREAAVEMVAALPGQSRITVGADKAYDTQDFVAELRELQATPHVAQNTSGRRSTIDGRTTRHVGYTISQRKRKRVEEIFGWEKTVGLLRKVRQRGRELVGWVFTFTAAAYNLMRMRMLVEEAK